MKKAEVQHHLHLGMCVVRESKVQINIMRWVWGSWKWRQELCCAAKCSCHWHWHTTFRHWFILFLLSFPVVIPGWFWAKKVKAEVEVCNILYIASLKCVKHWKDQWSTLSSCHGWDTRGHQGNCLLVRGSSQWQSSSPGSLWHKVSLLISGVPVPTVAQP